MDTQAIRRSGNHLAIAASIRILAFEMAKIANPVDPESWFTALGQKTFQYVDATSNPNFDEQTTKAVKEASYEALRMIFDPKAV